MQPCVIVFLFLSSGAVSGGLEKVIKQAEFVADIYQKLPHSCIFLITSEAEHQGFEATVLMQTVRKYFTYQYVPVMKNIIKSGSRQICISHRSIYVILRGNEETRSYISERLSDSYSCKAVWLLFLDNKTSLEQFFTDINIPFDCQFLVAQPQGDHVVVLTEVYRVSPTLPLQTYRFGNWSAGGGLTWPLQDFYKRRNNLEGHIIRAARLSVLVYRQQHHLEYLWTTIADSLHITNVFQGADSFGSENENGTWTGMIALVISGKTDIATGLFAAMMERYKVVDYSDTIAFGWSKVFTQLPNNSALTWNRYVAPFSCSLWLAVATAVCVLTVCLALAIYSRDRKQGLNVSAIIFYIHACCCQQGQPDNVRSTSGRIVIVTLHVTSLVLLAAYSAFLISSLAVQSQSLPFKDLQGLTDDGSYKLGVLANSSLFHMFDRATGGIESVAYKKLMAPFKKEMPKSYFDGFRRACADEKYAFLSNVLLARSYLRGKACKLVTLSRPAFRDTYALIISKNSSYKGIINWRLAHVRERGIWAKIRMVYKTLQQTEESTIDVSIVTVAPILLVLAAGYIMGIVVLVMERCVHANLCTYCTRKSTTRRPNADYYWLVQN